MNLKEQAAREAVKLVKDGMTVGLGAGSTMAYAAKFLKDAKDNGLSIKLCSSSFATNKLLEEYNFNILNIASVSTLDIYFDGCDQFDKDLHALKSGGGIHTMEKLLASMAKEFVLVGDDTKYVETFDTKFPLVIELLPQSLAFVQYQLEKTYPLAKPVLRMSNAKDGAVITEHGNYLIDIWFNEWPKLETINSILKSTSGIIETSLFYNIARKAVIAGENGVSVINRHQLL